MQTVEVTRRENLERLIQNEPFNGSVARFAEAAKVELNDVYRWKDAKGAHARNMRSDTARTIEGHLDLTEGYLDTPEISPEQLRVPLLDMPQAFHYASGKMQLRADQRTIDIPISAFKRGRFAFTAPNNDMLARDPRSIPKGALLLCAPDLPVRHDDIVFVATQTSTGGMVRRVLFADNKRVLLPLDAGFASQLSGGQVDANDLAFCIRIAHMTIGL